MKFPRKRTISIKWKIFLFLLGFTAVLLVILWLLQIAYLDSFYKMIKTNEAENVSKEAVSLLCSTTDESTINEGIDELAAANNVTLYVTDAQGSVIYSADYNFNSKIDFFSAEEFEQYYDAAAANNGTAKIEFEGDKNMTFQTQMMPAPLNQQTNKVDFLGQDHAMDMAESIIYVRIVTCDTGEYVVLLNSRITPVDATVKTLKVQLIWISVFMVLLSLVLALLMSRKISKSIIKVSNSAKRLANGDFAVTFEGNDYREIAELSNTLNYTAKELEKTENFRRELLANVSHDLRTPLTMIIAYAEVMRDLPGENTPENVQVVIDESKRLTNLVNDMLDISKLQAGVLEMHLSTYNLTESIRSVFERYNKLKEQEGYIINFEYEKEAIVEADEFKIYQVLYNLVNNAINYTGADKTVIVRQIVSQDTVKIEVSDSGEGIASEDIPYVWERYYKVDKTHKRAVAGTGLGLSIVQSILNLHHAEYGVESAAGEGSTFWFCLQCK